MKLTKCGGEIFHGKLHSLIKDIWRGEQLQKEWGKGNCSDYTNKKQTNCNNNNRHTVLLKIYVTTVAEECSTK